MFFHAVSIEMPFHISFPLSSSNVIFSVCISGASTSLPEAGSETHLFSRAVSVETLEDKMAKLPKLKVCLSRVDASNRQSPVADIGGLSQMHSSSAYSSTALPPHAPPERHEKPPPASGPPPRRGLLSELQEPVPGLPYKWRSQESTDALITAWANNSYCCPHPACSWYCVEARYPSNTTCDGPARRPFKLNSILSHWYITHMAPGYMVPFHCPGKHIRGKGLCDFITADENMLRDHLWHCDGTDEEKDIEVNRQKAYIERQVGPFFQPSDTLVLPKDEPEFDSEKDSYALKLSQTIAEVTNGPGLIRQEEEPPYSPPENLASYIPPFRANGDEIQINKFTDNAAPSKDTIKSKESKKPKPCPASKKMRLTENEPYVSPDPVSYVPPETSNDPVDYEDELINEAHILPKKRGRGRKRKIMKESQGTDGTSFQTSISSSKSDLSKPDSSLPDSSKPDDYRNDSQVGFDTHHFSVSPNKNGADLDDTDDLFPPTPRKDAPAQSAESLFDSIAFSSTNNETTNANLDTPTDLSTSAPHEKEPEPEPSEVENKADDSLPPEPKADEKDEANVIVKITKASSKSKGKSKGRGKKKAAAVEESLVGKEPDLGGNVIDDIPPIIENLPPPPASENHAAPEMVFEDVSLPSETEALANLDDVDPDKDQDRVNKEKSNQERSDQEKSSQEKSDQETSTPPVEEAQVQEDTVAPTEEASVPEDEPVVKGKRSRKALKPKKNKGRQRREIASEPVPSVSEAPDAAIPDALATTDVDAPVEPIGDKPVQNAESNIDIPHAADADNKSIQSEQDIFQSDVPKTTELAAQVTEDHEPVVEEQPEQPEPDTETVQEEVSTARGRKGRGKKKKAASRGRSEQVIEKQNEEPPPEQPEQVNEPEPSTMESEPTEPQAEEPQADPPPSAPDTSDEDLVITEVIIAKTSNKRRSGRRGPSIDTQQSSSTAENEEPPVAGASVETPKPKPGPKSRRARQIAMASRLQEGPAEVSAEGSTTEIMADHTHSVDTVQSSADTEEETAGSVTETPKRRPGSKSRRSRKAKEPAAEVAVEEPPAEPAEPIAEPADTAKNNAAENEDVAATETTAEVAASETTTEVAKSTTGPKARSRKRGKSAHLQVSIDKLAEEANDKSIEESVVEHNAQAVVEPMETVDTVQTGTTTESEEVSTSEAPTDIPKPKPGSRSRSRRRGKAAQSHAVPVEEAVEEPAAEPIAESVTEPSAQPEEPATESVVEPDVEAQESQDEPMEEAGNENVQPKVTQRKPRKGKKGKRRGAPVRKAQLVEESATEAAADPTAAVEEPIEPMEQQSEAVPDPICKPVQDTTVAPAEPAPVEGSSPDDEQAANARPSRSKSQKGRKAASRPRRGTRSREKSQESADPAPENADQEQAEQVQAQEVVQEKVEESSSKEKDVQETVETSQETTETIQQPTEMEVEQARPLPRGRKAKGRGRKGRRGQAEKQVEEPMEEVIEELTAQKYQTVNESVQSILLGCKTVLGAVMSKCTDTSTKNDLIAEGVTMLETVLSCRKSLDETIPELYKLADKTPDELLSHNKDSNEAELEQKLAESEQKLAEATRQFEKDQAESDNKICSLTQQLEDMKVKLAVSTGIQTSVKSVNFAPSTGIQSPLPSVPMTSDAMVVVPSLTNTTPSNTPSKRRGRSSRGATTQEEVPPTTTEPTTSTATNESLFTPMKSSLLGPFGDTLRTDDILGQFLKPKQVVGVFDESQIESAMSGVRDLVKMLASVQPIEQLSPSVLAQMKSASEKS